MSQADGIRPAAPDARPVVLALRFGVWAFTGVLAATTGRLGELALPFLLLGVVAILASIPGLPRSARIASPIVEVMIAAAIIGGLTMLPEPLVPYLVIPPVAAGLETGLILALTTALFGTVTLTVTEALTSGLSRSSAVSIVQITGLALVTGILAGWARRGRLRSARAADIYLAAHQLLSQLRDVARALPSGLDEVTLAQSLLADVASIAPFDRAAVYLLNDRGVLLPLTVRGTERSAWDPEASPLWAHVLQTGTYTHSATPFAPGRPGASAVIPLRMGELCIGVIGIERSGALWHDETLDAVQAQADQAALRIDSGRLFSDVRALATVEERRRLAREIHDGVAQEVASLGYAVDDMAARSENAELSADLQALRGELTRIVTELRLSIFDLRSDVEPATGLGAALSSYVRQVGTSAGLSVHLVLEESTRRLSVEVETELLRIAQEAVTNARRHSHALNLWVTCRVNPPRAFLRIADDGRGLGSPRNDSYGLEIMRERAARLGARLRVRRREGGGTLVEVTLGGDDEAGERNPNREEVNSWRSPS